MCENVVSGYVVFWVRLIVWYEYVYDDKVVGLAANMVFVDLYDGDVSGGSICPLFRKDKGIVRYAR